MAVESRVAARRLPCLPSCATKRYTYFFFSSEGVPREPIHVHVRGHGGVAKIWIEPTVMIAHASGIPAKTLRELVRFAADHRDYFIESWKEYFDD